MSMATVRQRLVLWALGAILAVSLSMPPFASAQDEIPYPTHRRLGTIDSDAILVYARVIKTRILGGSIYQAVEYTYVHLKTGAEWTVVVPEVSYMVLRPLKPDGILPVFAFASLGGVENHVSRLAPGGSVARDPCQEEVDEGLDRCVRITPWDPGWPQTSELLIDQADVGQIEREYRRIHSVLISGELDTADLNRLRSSTIRLRRALTTLLQRIGASPGADESQRANALALATRWVRIAEAMTGMVEAYGESASRQR